MKKFLVIILAILLSTGLAFAKGYEVDGVAVREDGPIYILTRR